MARRQRGLGAREGRRNIARDGACAAHPAADIGLEERGQQVRMALKHLPQDGQEALV